MDERRTVTIPIRPNLWATLTCVFPLTQKDWDQLQHVLNVMRPSLVSKAAQRETSAPPESETP